MEVSLTKIIAFATAIYLVESEYVVMVKTHYFNNPPHYLLNSGECYYFSATRTYAQCDILGCDIYFQYCLTELVDYVVRSSCEISETNYDGTPINFSAPTFLGLPNPLSLPGQTRENTSTPNGTWLTVNVYRGESARHDEVRNRCIESRKVFKTFIILPKLVGEKHSIIMDPAQIPSIGLSIRVECAKYYYGPDCSQYCTSNCTCDPKYTGEFCHEINECFNVTCNHNGQCLGNFTCVCNPGYSGSNCEIVLNECERMETTCNNRGQCVDGVNNFTCNCDKGFTGEFCQSNIDDCIGVNCSGNGKCVDGIESFTCQCETGYSGTFCVELEEVQNHDDGVQVGVTLGGVLGVFVSLILCLMIIAIVAIIHNSMKYSSRRRKTIDKRTGHYSTHVTVQCENSVCEEGNTADKQEPHISDPVQYMKASSSDGDNIVTVVSSHDSSPDRLFNNPIYGCSEEELENMYALPDTEDQPGTSTGIESSPHYHKFDNPIYGFDEDENAYSTIAS